MKLSPDAIVVHGSKTVGPHSWVHSWTIFQSDAICCDVCRRSLRRCHYFRIEGTFNFLQVDREVIGYAEGNGPFQMMYDCEIHTPFTFIMPEMDRSLKNKQTMLSLGVGAEHSPGNSQEL